MVGDEGLQTLVFVVVLGIAVNHQGMAVPLQALGGHVGDDEPGRQVFEHCAPAVVGRLHDL